ncbi:ribose-5-phosphate isomerase RpiA [Devosia sp.]|uniref:ribose-5-phosphate isomerase RpiA n=1 Tax=Devosia sp. TaxID=1871048 RepID=UPI003BABCB5A
MGEDFKRLAAIAALDEVRSGMRLGLGTGSTARHFVDLIGERVAAGLDVVCVPTSEVTAAQARALGISLTDLETTPELDLTVDGADEIGPGLALIKGAGGALLREKIVAAASARMIVIADISKKVAVLGKFPLSIEANLFGLGATFRQIEKLLVTMGAQGGLVQRRRTDGSAFITDGGHVILDASFGRISDPEALADALIDIPGVVQHGLFIGLCKRAYVAGPAGIEVLDA